jgi:hypothetical protein
MSASGLLLPFASVSDFGGQYPAFDRFIESSMLDPIAKAIVAARICLQMRHRETLFALTLPIEEDPSLLSAIEVTRQAIRYSRERAKALTFDELCNAIQHGSEKLELGEASSPRT